MLISLLDESLANILHIDSALAHYLPSKWLPKDHRRVVQIGLGELFRDLLEPQYASQVGLFGILGVPTSCTGE